MQCRKIKTFIKKIDYVFTPRVLSQNLRVSNISSKDTFGSLHYTTLHLILMSSEKRKNLSILINDHSPHVLVSCGQSPAGEGLTCEAVM